MAAITRLLDETDFDPPTAEPAPNLSRVQIELHDIGKSQCFRHVIPPRGSITEVCRRLIDVAKAQEERLLSREAADEEVVSELEKLTRNVDHVEKCRYALSDRDISRRLIQVLRRATMPTG